MKSTCPPPQVIFVGLESNQHGHAASHEQASSSCPVIFHGVLSCVLSDARPMETVERKLAASIGTIAINRAVLMIRKTTPEICGHKFIRNSSPIDETGCKKGPRQSAAADAEMDGLVMARRMAARGALSLNSIRPDLCSTPSCFHNDAKSTGAGAALIFS
jgi:hypothetical protein